VELLVIFLASIFTNNILLAQFLGLCPFIGVSSNVKTATGMGTAVIFVMVLSAAICWPVNHYVLAGTIGGVAYDVRFLQPLVFILVIASLVQLVEMVVEKTSEALYINLGVFLPLITVNCAILGLVLFMVIRDYDFTKSLVYAAGSGVGWSGAIILMGGIRQKLRFSPMPRGLRGPAITVITAGIMAMAFSGLTGVVNL
jgi:RnfABCDGE-type electron transport complex A subunit